MSDRELLELAAKAVGLNVRWVDTDYEQTFKVPYETDTSNGWRSWNPLTDDGDALRLAVRLAMTLRQEPSYASAGWETGTYGAPTLDRRGPWFWKEWLSDNQDPYAATRRAIVRAAAEIVRTMK